MKKLILLLACACFPVLIFAQTTITIWAGGGAGGVSSLGSYITGTATDTLPAGTYTRTDNIIAVTNSGSTRQAGYAVFDLSSIPAGASISSVILGINIEGATINVYEPCITYGHLTDLSTVTSAATLYTDCTTAFGPPGSILIANAATASAAGSYLLPVPGIGELDINSTAAPALVTFVTSAINNLSVPKKVSISFSAGALAAGGSPNVYNFTGDAGSQALSGPHAPHLQITYLAPCTGTPSPGRVSANVSSACAATAITLTHTITASGLHYQWQSSPDSITWNSIIGATSSGYNFTGLSATTYYRCVDTCVASGLSSPTAGQKISYLSCCSGTPVAGIATASTAYCSTCSLTLNLTGYTSAGGITFQWQTSPDSVTWSNIAGATTVPYTFSPPGSYFYRCMVTCASGGSSAYSGGVKVLYRYLIIQDTVSNTLLGTSCPGPGPQFYVKVNGTSPLLGLKTYYGDGTNDSISFTPATGYSYTAHNHNYAVSGTYTIKQIVYWNNIPQDSLIYSYVFTRCNLLHIGLYLDMNGNCIKDPAERANPALVTIRIDSAGIPIGTVSVTSGLNYKAYGPAGTVYSFTIISPSYYTVCPVSGVLNHTISSGSVYPVKYFGLNCPSGSFDLAIHSTYSCAGINVQKGRFLVYNNLCTSTYATATLSFSPKYAYASASPAPASVSGNTITWNMLLSATSVPWSPMLNYRLVPAVPGILSLGDTIQSHFSITPVFGDLNVTNNTESIIDTVVSPFDPNHISVSPPDCFPSDTQFQYTINFENTGNDTAHNIHIMDTLSANLDMHSLNIVTASAEMNVTVYNDGPYNIAKFDFPNINLLDSSHQGLCDGAVFFTIKNKAGIPPGSTIFNRAGIYFDDNDVVMTNTVENLKGCTESVQIMNATHQLEIYPNPATDELTIKMETGAYSSFTITNNVGQELMQQQLNKAITKVNVKLLPPGLYYITVKGDSGATVQKFVKM